MNIKYQAAILDCSGYAEAARSYILALLSQKVKVTITPFTFESYRPKDVGHSAQLQPLYNKQLDYKVNIIHMTGDHLPRLYEKGKYNVSLCVWETNRLPALWVTYFNQFCEECWVPSEYCADTWRQSGVRKPIYVMEHALDTEDYFTERPWHIESLDPEAYKFYSIFQWSERKNASCFIEAYLREFNQSDKVALILKTFIRDNSANDLRELKSYITTIKDKIKKVNAPRMYLIHGSLDRDQVNSIHVLGDCFLSSFRSEGVGLPLVEAALAGKRVIAPRGTGIVDYLPEDLTDYFDAGVLIPAGNMKHISNLYTPDMLWHAPKISTVREQIRAVYNSREDKTKNAALAAHIKTNFSFKAIGQKMINRLKEIEKGI